MLRLNCFVFIEWTINLIASALQLPVPPRINTVPLNRFLDCGKFTELKDLIGSGLKLENSETLSNNQVHKE